MIVHAMNCSCDLAEVVSSNPCTGTPGARVRGTPLVVDRTAWSHTAKENADEYCEQFDRPIETATFGGLFRFPACVRVEQRKLAERAGDRVAVRTLELKKAKGFRFPKDRRVAARSMSFRGAIPSFRAFYKEIAVCASCEDATTCVGRFSLVSQWRFWPQRRPASPK
jgi:hypothetical protein